MKETSAKSLSRRDFLKLSLAAATLAAFRPLPGNELRQLSEEIIRNPVEQVNSTAAVSGPKYSPQTILAANRLTFGAKPADLDWIQLNGVDAFIEEQLAFEKIDDSAVNQRLQKLVLLNQSASAPAPSSDVNVLLQLQQAALLRAVYSQRQLYEVMIDFWNNHFNTYFRLPSDYILKVIDDRDVMRAFGMGKFRDLLGASAHSPAMLIALDTSTSIAKQPNENYARELMELYTIGTNGGFTEKDVVDVARSFTGWTVEQTVNKKPIVGTFTFKGVFHDQSPKVILGHRLQISQGEKDGEAVLDILAATPACAAFISNKLAQRFISDTPPDSVVNKGAAAFQNSQGDIRATLGAILHSQEFKTSLDLKVKRPLDYAVSALRVLNAETDGSNAIQSFILRMGQPLFQWPNPDGYPDTAEAWVNSGSMMARWNFAKALVSNLIPGTQVDLKSLVSKNGVMVDDLSQAILFGPLSSSALGVLKTFTDPRKIAEVAALLIASPSFQLRS
jgi:uncharacterized protein (DUF1800 family)